MIGVPGGHPPPPAPPGGPCENKTAETETAASFFHDRQYHK